MLTLKDVLEAPDHAFSDWIIWGIADDPCASCSGPVCVAADPNSSVPGATHVLVCVSEKSHFVSTELPMASQHLISDRFNQVLDRSCLADSNERVVAAVRLLSLTLSKAGPVTNKLQPREAIQIDTNPKVRAGTIDVPIPVGYRSVSWIRDYEAEAVISAYKSRNSFELKNDAGVPVLRVNYFADSAPESLKFKANVEVLRVRSSGTRMVGWIRLEEARAVVEANTLERDVQFLHVRYGQGGLVQYFPSHSAEAQTYRSTTRLLRKS